MSKFLVEIKNTETGETDIQEVEALDEWKARTRAMMRTKLRMNGAMANYEVTEVN